MSTDAGAAAPDYTAIAKFAKLARGEGPHVLCAFPINKATHQPKANSFYPMTLDRVKDWMEPLVGTHNFYIHVGHTAGLGKKGDTADIISVDKLFVDIDGPDLDPDDPELEAKHAAWLVERQRAIPELCKQQNTPEPTGLNITGCNGIQLWWQMATPFTVNGKKEAADEYKRYNQRLAALLGGDAPVVDSARVLRLVGTPNTPNEEKRKRGRLPAMARTVFWHTNRVYRWDQFQQADAAAQVADDLPELNIDTTIEFDGGELEDLALPKELRDIILDGMKVDPEKKRWKSRSEQEYYVTCELIRRDVPNSAIYAILKTFKVGESCQEKGDRYTFRQIERAHQEVAAQRDAGDIGGIVRKMREEGIAVISLKGKARVARAVPDIDHPTQQIYEFSTVKDFGVICQHPMVNVGKVDKPMMKSRGLAYVDHGGRAEHHGVCFKPGEPLIISVGNTTHLNMYGGFAVVPKEGDCSRYLDFVRDIVCDGNPEVYEYVLDELAAIVQQPGSLLQTVSFILIGEKGVGKGVFADEFGKLFGRHYCYLQDQTMVTSKFNASQAEAILTFVDETVNLRDPKAAAVMKGLIHTRVKQIERKGIDPIQASNYTRIWFASNDDNPVVIEEKDRRYLPLRFSDKRCKDRDYFQALCDQMNNGGREALLHFLLHRDISGFNAQAIPETAERKYQQLQSAPAGLRVAIQWAKDAHLPGALVGRSGKAKDRPHIAPSRELYEDMKRAEPSLKDESEVILSRTLDDVGFATKHLGTCTGKQAPPLDVLRKTLEERFPALVGTWNAAAHWGESSEAMEKRLKAEAEEEQRRRMLPFLPEDRRGVKETTDEA